MGALLFSLLLALSLCSCGPNYHLKRAKYHERMAIAKGAIIVSDTVYIETPVPVVTIDTLVDSVSLETLVRDTIFIQTTQWRVKIKYDSASNKLHVQAEAQPDPVKAPAVVNKQVIAPPPRQKNLWWQPYVTGLLIFLVGYIVGRLTKR